MNLIQRQDNKYRTQEEHINDYNGKNQVMISLPDTLKLLNNQEAVESLRKDFDDRWLVTSTRVIYNPDNLSAKVIHHAGSTVTKEKVIQLKEVPECNPTYLNKLIETEEGLKYLKALIDNNKATKKQIIDLFTTLSGKEANKIRFWTPTQSSRGSKSVRSVDLYFNVFSRFYVCGFNWFDYDDGLSRGVIINSAKQSKFFSNKAIFDLEDKTITIPMQKKLLKDIEKKQSEKGKVKIKWKLEVDVK